MNKLDKITIEKIINDIAGNDFPVRFKDPCGLDFMIALGSEEKCCHDYMINDIIDKLYEWKEIYPQMYISTRYQRYGRSMGISLTD